jgi:hypothetical protein
MNLIREGIRIDLILVGLDLNKRASGGGNEVFSFAFGH